MAVNLLNVNVRETLAFFDEKPCWSERQATAIVGVLGEDLSAAVLQHCLEANEASNVYVRNETVGTGGRSGPRLDRWIEADLPGGKKVLFQTEIKSWSAHAIGGEVLRLSAPAEEWRITSEGIGESIGTPNSRPSRGPKSPRCWSP